MKEIFKKYVSQINSITNTDYMDRNLEITYGENTKSVLDAILPNWESLMVNKPDTKNTQDFVSYVFNMSNVLNDIQSGRFAKFNLKFSDNPNEFTIKLS